MADGSSGHGGVLGLKARAAQKAFEARGMSPAKALRRALSRSADTLWDLALVCQTVQMEMLDQDGVIAALPQGHLLLLLDGPEGAVGLAAVDREVLAGVVEVQTIQQVTTLPADTERVLTVTDAAMMAPLIDGTMERFARNLEDHPLRAALEGYRYGALVEDARAVSLLLDAPAYRIFEVTVDLALGRRRGVLRVILPDLPRRRDEDAEGEAHGAGPHEAAMARLPIRLDAVLTRLVLPLNRAQALKPGDLLPLAPDALDAAILLAAKGQRIAGGRLGQMNGMRAIRLNWPEGVAGPPAAAMTAVATVSEAGPVAAFAPSPARATPEPEVLPDLPPLMFGEDDFGGLADLDTGDGAGDFAAAPLEFDFDG